ncbi:hypothetical protein pb186bvf_014493 [Paramecium bursaria]
MFVKLLRVFIIQEVYKKAFQLQIIIFKSYIIFQVIQIIYKLFQGLIKFINLCLYLLNYKLIFPFVNLPLIPYLLDNIFNCASKQIILNNTLIIINCIDDQQINAIIIEFCRNLATIFKRHFLFTLLCFIKNQQYSFFFGILAQEDLSKYFIQ